MEICKWVLEFELYDKTSEINTDSGMRVDYMTIIVDVNINNGIH